MDPRVLGVRAPILAALLVVLLALASLSSLLRLLPDGPWALWGILALGLALLPALLARETPLPAAALVVVPTLAAASYGASRLDWLRVLKDFGVAEGAAVHPVRLALAALALVLLWTLHAADTAARLRLRALERGVDAAQANAAAARSARESAKALALAAGGAIGLLLLALVAFAASDALPTQRAALAAPLVAAALLVAAAVWLARPRSS